MARQRAIRPEYFRDRVMGKLGPVVGTVYQALWVWADDGGVARCDPQVLKAECFLWWPDVTVAVITDALARLSGARRVRLWSEGDDLYAEIPTLAKHSPVSHPGKFRYPRKGQEVTDVKAWISGQLTHEALRRPCGDPPESIPSLLPLPLAVSDTYKAVARAETAKPEAGGSTAGFEAFAKALAPHDHRARQYLEGSGGKP